MKVYFNRAGIAPAIIGLLCLINQSFVTLTHKKQIFFGNSEFAPLTFWALGFAFTSFLFRRANRKIPSTLLKPRKIKWSMPKEQAFARIKETMNRTALLNSARGISDWQPISEEREQGSLRYKRIVQEYSDEITNPRILTGEMSLAIQLIQTGAETELMTEYQVLSELMTLTVIEVVTETNTRIDSAGK